jgi:hypothetical protein
MLIHCKPYNSSHRWLAVADLHTSPVITIDIQQINQSKNDLLFLIIITAVAYI